MQESKVSERGDFFMFPFVFFIIIILYSVKVQVLKLFFCFLGEVLLVKA